MQNNSNHRRDFLKKLTFAFGSFILFSGFKFKNQSNIETNINKSKNDNSNFKTISKSEAEDLIKKSNTEINLQLKPEPAPIEKHVK